jgi:proline racemase
MDVINVSFGTMFYSLVKASEQSKKIKKASQHHIYKQNNKKKKIKT